jgi:isoquinoline 1-oxidoreductase subunit beta
MADHSPQDISAALPIEAKSIKRKGLKRRAFLIGGAGLLGAGAFGLYWGDASATKRAKAMTVHGKEGSFLTWLKISEDDSVTLYVPHIDFGQGSHTALAQMLADELDADWARVKVEQAQAETAFANTALIKGLLTDLSGSAGFINALPTALLSMVARSVPLQMTGGSSAVRATGQFGMRVVGAAARLALIAEAADRLGVPASELATKNSVLTHVKSGKSLRYGELAVAAAERSLASAPKLKERKDYSYIGKSVARLDIPPKVDGSAQYGIDFKLPDMRVATIMAAPVRGGKLQSVDEKLAMAIAGVEKVVKLEDAVIVVAKGYWQALKGLQALTPAFSDAGHGALTSASIYAAQNAKRKAGKADGEAGDGDVDAAFAAAGAKVVEATYHVPFLHHAMMEPVALTGHYKDGKLDIWGGTQDPVATKMMAAAAAELDSDLVTFHPMIMGGGFGRRFPDQYEAIGQIARLAKQLSYPVKLIWSREEEVTHGTYRGQNSARLKAALGKDGKITAYRNDYVQSGTAEGEVGFIYTVPATSRRHFDYKSNQWDGAWRSVNSSQHGFYNESFMDELAHAAGQDPYKFRRAHLATGSRHLAVLDMVAKRSGWGTPLAAGHGRGIAIVDSFGTVVAQVVEASLKADGTPKVHKAWAVVDCGTTVNPRNADAQIMGGLIMSLSATMGEEITIDKGAVVQSNFSDYPILKMADAPVTVDVHFIESDAQMGGIGEPGVPPASAALANALFALTGKRVRTLPIKSQASVI